MSDNKVDLSTALPLSLWRTRDGHKAVFGCYIPDNKEYCCVGFIDEQPIAWRRDGTNFVDSYRIIAPLPKEPVSFETDIENILGTPIGNMGMIKDSILTPLIGKRVRVTVEELP